MDRTQDGSGRVLDACLGALKRAVAWTPVTFSLMGSLALLLAAMPALQVLAVTRLTAALGRGDERASLILSILSAGTIAAMYGLSALMLDIANLQSYAMQTRYHSELRSRLAYMSPSEMARPETSTRFEAARAAVDYTLSNLPRNLLTVGGAALSACGLLASLWPVSPWAALLVVGSLIPTLLGAARMARLRRDFSTALAENSRAERYLGDQLIYQRPATELATLGTAPVLAGLADRYALDNLARVRVFCFKWMRMNAVISAANLVIIAAALISIADASGAYETAAAGILGVVSGVAATRGAGEAAGQIAAATPLAAIYSEAVSTSRSIAHQTPSADADVLCAEELSYAYPGQAEFTLEGFNFQVRSGEIVAIVGVNGAGKTTAIKCLMGVLAPSSGRVLLDGKDIQAMREGQRYAYFGALAQDYGRFELTIRDSLRLSGRVVEDDERLWEALRWAKADAFVANLPEGLDTQLGEQWEGVGLSGGQWQRLSLARIYLRGASIWILDEPTSAIDAEAERGICETLSKCKGGHMTVVVSHRASTLRRMDRIFVLDGGKCVQEGTFDELVKAPGRFAEIFIEDC